MVYDYSSLLVLINKKFGNVSNLAKEIGCDPRTLADKIANIRDFTFGDAEKILEKLGVPREKITDYFFVLAS